MKRRGFLKGLAALALAPLAVASKAAAPEPLPAHTIPNPDGPVHLGPYTKKAVALAKQAMRRMETSSDSAAKAAAEMREALTDLYISPEVMEDIRKWGADQIDEETRRAVLLANDNGIVSDETAYRAVAMKGPLVCSAWGYDMEGEPKPNRNGDIFDSKGEIKDDNPYSGHCQHISVSMPLDREEINELGRRVPYHTFVKFPVELDMGGAPEQLEKLDA